MNLLKKSVLVALYSILFLVTALTYIFEMWGPFYGSVTNILYLSSTFLAFASGAYLTSTYGLRNISGKAFLFITLGLLFWFIGEFSWIYYELYLSISPFASLPDIFILTGFPLIAGGFLIYTKKVQIKLNRNKKIFLFVFSSLLAIAIIYILIKFEVKPEMENAEKIVNILRAIGHSWLLISGIIALLIAKEYQGGQLSLPWKIFIIAIIANFAGDIIQGSHPHLYEEEVPLIYISADLLWILAYLLFSTSLFFIAFSVKEAQDKITGK
ncbi:hypothetical protein KJ632_01425 [Patescibacteria group bacterium]|nr:hypothetical protein [Patescibacteria group bacterium]